MKSFHRSAACFLVLLTATGCDSLFGPSADTVAPTIELSSSPATIEADSLVLTGTATDDRGVVALAYTLDGAPPESISISPGKRVDFSFTLSGLALGAHEVVLIATDEAGIEGTATLRASTVDAHAPVLTITSPTENSTLALGQVSIQGTVNDDWGIDRLSYRVNGGAEVAIPANSAKEFNFDFLPSGVDEGPNQIEVVATDLGENADTVIRSFTSYRVPFSPTQVTLRKILTGLDRPLHLGAPTGDDRLFIVEQPGKIRVAVDGVVLPTPFLDWTSEVAYGADEGAGGEEGLLGLAFHPDYDQNGFFYIFYSGTDYDTRLVRFQRSSDPNRADPASAQTVLTVDQPDDRPGNHKAGTIFFDREGLLYIALGDGAAAADYHGNAQNPATLLGSILRIDVDTGSPYSIPPSNPFVGDPTARPEIWAFGLRNPWRISTDWVSGRVIIPDVGEDEWEEVNIVATPAPLKNFGWPVVEGISCLFRNPDCDKSAYDAPQFLYSHSEGCSIIGGHVYRGSRIPGLWGHYVYSDFCQGFLRSFVIAGSGTSDEQSWNANLGFGVSAIGEDGSGELYVLTRSGDVYRVEPAS